MKVSTELNFANRTLVGKPVRIDNKIVGKIVSVKGTNVISEIHDLKTVKKIMDGKVPGYSMGALYA